MCSPVRLALAAAATAQDALPIAHTVAPRLELAATAGATAPYPGMLGVRASHGTLARTANLIVRLDTQLRRFGANLRVPVIPRVGVAFVWRPERGRR